MSSNPIKIVLADDHQLFLDGVEQILSTSESFTVLAKVDNGKLLIQTLNRIRPDLILLDINMPYMTGMEAARIIRSSLPDIKLVFLSMYYDAKIISLAKQQGVNGFILKSTTATELRETLVRVMEGETVFVSIKDTAQAETAEDAFTKRFKLSPRELEIIQFIKQGKSTKEIADLLTLSFFTVETHRKNIFRKLDVVNVGQLVSFAKDNNI